MTRLTSFVAALCLTVLLPLSARAEGLEATPASAENLDSILRRLAEMHDETPWCDGGCATFLEVRFSGRLADGRLVVEMSGSVPGDEPAWVELFGTRPWSRLEALTDPRSGRALPVFWSGSAYAVVLQPGPFRLRGTLRFGSKTALSLTVQGPAGLVRLDVADADVVGSGSVRAVRNATYQLTPRAAADEAKKAAKPKLRLTVERRFHLARDKTFVVSVSARGARPGQVIPLPLATGETIEDLDRRVATLRPEQRRIDWVAASSTPTLEYAGKWTGESIALTAPAGATKETWRVQCDDPYLCSFDGDAEAQTGATGHIWEPLPGQTLTIGWRELDPLTGVHTVAQSVAIATRPTGKNLRQKMRIDWQSSSGSLASMELPPDAVISTFTLDDEPTPILKDESGAVRVNLPTGSSVLEVEWELADAARWLIRPPVPKLSQPVASLWHGVTPADEHNVILAGGLPGSPRVALWPDLVACLLLAGLLVWLARRGEQPISSVPLWLISAAGFALLSPAAVIPVAALLGLSRWWGTSEKKRGRLRAFVELAIWAGLILTAVILVLVVLNGALFSDDPIEIDSFVSADQIPRIGDWSPNSVTWGIFVAGAPAASKALATPWALSLPIIVVRLLWAGWAVVLATLFYREGRLMLDHIRSYWGTIVVPEKKKKRERQPGPDTRPPPHDR